MTRALRLLALLLLAVALYQGALVGAEVLVGRDLLRQFVPRGRVIGDALARGEVPLWNPWCGHGAPWFGPRAGGVIYPGHVLYALLPIGPAIAWFIALHHLLALAGMWRLARRDPGGSPWVAAIVWGVGGYTASLYWALPYLVSAAWTPWALVGAHRLAAGDPRGAGLTGAALGLMLLAGEPQGALIAGLLCVPTAARVAPAGGRLRALGLLGLAAALGAATGGPMLTSILDEVPRIDRTLTAWKELRFPLQGRALLLDALVPNVHGHGQQHTGGFWATHTFWGGDMPWCQLGVGALGLAALVAALPLAGAQAARPARALWARLFRGEAPAARGPAGGGAALEALAWVALGLVLAAVDAGAPLGLRYPSKWLVITALGLARLVGLGAAALARDLPGPGLAPVAGQGLTVGLALAGVLLGAFVALGGPGGPVVAAGGPDVEAWLVSHAPGYAMGAPARRVTAEALVRAGVAAALALALLRARATGRASPRAFHALTCGLLALDLVTAARPVVLAAPPEVLDPPPLVATLQDAAGPPAGAPPRFEPKNVFWRYQHPPLAFPAREVDTVACLRTNVGYGFGVRTVLPFESVEPAQVYRIQSDPRYHALPLFGQGALLDAQVMLLDPRDETRIGVPLKDARILGEPIGEYHLLAVLNPLCPPWAYLVGGAREGGDLDEARRLVFDRLRRPQETVVLGPERPASAGGGPAEAAVEGGAVRATAFEADRVALEVDAPAACWLVVRDAFDANWTATVDGAPAPIARADLLYRAVRLEAGAHAVVFEYRPAWWPRGLALLAVGWLAVAALGLAAPRR